MKTIQKLTAAILLTASCAGMSVSCVPRSETKNLKIICYNILYGMRRDTTQGKRLFAEWVRQQNPDILALQEVNDFTQFTLETLAAEYGHDYAVISKDPKLIPGSVGSRTKFPVSISSKSPVVNVDKVLDNMWHGFIKCKVEGYNVIVLHLNPHLYEARRREIRTVLETVKQSGPFEKWIIMGDFNWQEFGLFDDIFPGTTKANGMHNRLRTTADGYMFDNMIFSPSVQAENVRVLDTGHSDHSMLLADIVIGPEEPQRKGECV